MRVIIYRTYYIGASRPWIQTDYILSYQIIATSVASTSLFFVQHFIAVKSDYDVHRCCEIVDIRFGQWKNQNK